MAKDNNLSAPQFHDVDKARQYLESQVWPDGPVCPHCGSLSKDHYKLEGKTTRSGLYKCKDCREPFTVTVGTVFERSKVPLNKWLMATYLLCSSKKGMSSHQLHRTIGVTYKTAWFMTHRIREAMTPKTTGQLGGACLPVEADETYWGREKKAIKRPGGGHKMKVVSLVERHGLVRSFHVSRVTSATLKPLLITHIKLDSHLMTDEHTIYKGIGKNFSAHSFVNHGNEEYARGAVTTNTVEGFFSILKRGLIGTFHHVGEQHLGRYVKEFDFRYNHRTALGYTDAERYVEALKAIRGKRLTYRRTDETTRNLEGDAN
jgi:transposase-like protein